MSPRSFSLYLARIVFAPLTAALLLAAALGLMLAAHHGGPSLTGALLLIASAPPFWLGVREWHLVRASRMAASLFFGFTVAQASAKKTLGREPSLAESLREFADGSERAERGEGVRP